MALIVDALEVLSPRAAELGIRAWLDGPQAGSVAQPGGYLTLEGWVVAPGNVRIQVVSASGAVLVETPLNRPRTDVAAAIPGAQPPCGFEIELDARLAGDFATVQVLSDNSTAPAPLGRVHIGTVPDESAANRESQDGEPTVLRRLVTMISGMAQPTVETHPSTEPSTEPSAEPQPASETTMPWIVDVGAHDGSFLSNSSPFIGAGWEALLVEPAPGPFATLQETYRDTPNVRCINAACSDYEGTAKLWIGNDGDNGTNSTLSTDTNDWFSATRSDRSIEVTVRTLTELCREHGVPERFPILLVDAEGMDLDVLRGLDPTKHRPLIVCTERYLHGPEKEAAKADLLRSWGLIPHGHVGYNDIWVDPSAVAFN